MKIVSWNVNGIRACIKKGFMDYLDSENPDIMCLQETKIDEEQINFLLPNYKQYWNCANKKGYSGTAIFSKVTPLSVSYDMSIEEHDKEGRVICAEYDDFFLVTVYTPNAKRDLSRLAYRMQWEDDFLAYLKNLEEMKPVIVCGDFNVAHQEIDIKNVKSNIGCSGFTYEEREKFTKLMEVGFIDTFRYLHPELTDQYTWWSYMGNARKNNTGWRIDYFIMSDSYKEVLESAFIRPEQIGSDHCPVGIDIKRTQE